MLKKIAQNSRRVKRILAQERSQMTAFLQEIGLSKGLRTPPFPSNIYGSPGWEKRAHKHE
jgi:hypothetical protein